MCQTLLSGANEQVTQGMLRSAFFFDDHALRRFWFHWRLDFLSLLENESLASSTGNATIPSGSNGPQRRSNLERSCC